jgi:hypothetical protein
MAEPEPGCKPRFVRFVHRTVDSLTIGQKCGSTSGKISGLPSQHARLDHHGNSSQGMCAFDPEDIYDNISNQTVSCVASLKSLRLAYLYTKMWDNYCKAEGFFDAVHAAIETSPDVNICATYPIERDPPVTPKDHVHMVAPEI